MTFPPINMNAEFRRVVDDFKAKAQLTPEELQLFQLDKLSDVESVLSSIQSKQKQAKRLVFMKRLDPFLKTMLEFGKVIDVFVNSSDILAFVWGPLKLLLSVASNLTDAFNALLDTYQHIGEQIPLLTTYTSLFYEHAHMRAILVLIYKDILEFHVLALKFFRQKIWKQLFQSSWKGYASGIELLKDNFSRHRRLIEEHGSLTQFEEMRSNARTSEESFRGLKEDAWRRRKLAVFRWLASPSVEAAHEHHMTARASNPQACRWILQEQSFQKWFDPLYCATPLLWIQGKPGAGKSVLASLIIDEAKALKNVSVGFFYCAYGDPERNGFVPMARAILSQLLAQDESLLLHLDKAMSTAGTQTVLSSHELAKSLLQIALQSRKTFLILDGIDECEKGPRYEICSWYKSVVNHLPRTEQDEIRCLFISQDDGLARKDLSMLPTLGITPDHNRADIQAFVQASQDRIEARLGPCPIGPSGLDITRVITARAQGMFIYAKCVLEELEQYPTRDSLQKDWPAESFPIGMEDVYDRIHRRLTEVPNRPRKEMTDKVLSWISLSKRPMRWYEIQAAISIDLDEETINKESRRPPDPKELCASFVEVVSEQTVLLVHSTARDYLIKRGIIDPFQVDLELCLLSMGYLCFPEISSTISTDEAREALVKGSYSFYDYAVACWLPHLMSWLSANRPKESSMMEELKETLESFLQRHYSGDGTNSLISSKMNDTLSVFKEFGFYEDLAQAVVWTRKQLSVDGNDDNTKRMCFPEITALVRGAFESFVFSDLPVQTAASLKLLYGEKWFKCPLIYCQYFYKGFSTREVRDQHVTRHERAYTCTIDGCPTATFGCVSKSSLEKHMLENHGMLNDRDEFLPISNPNSVRTSNQPARFQCTLCPKKFTRMHNLRSHTRSHTDVRPFVCTVCGQRFRRQGDCRRHELAAHHLEEQPTGQGVVCNGKLGTGRYWGCGKSFASVAEFVSHMRTGKCASWMKPLLDEERHHLGSRAELSASLVEQCPVVLAEMRQQPAMGEDATHAG